MRKKLGQTVGISTSLHKKIPSSKSLSKTKHISARNTSMETKKLSRCQKSEIVSPYQAKLSEYCKNKASQHKLPK
jgi:hypothetical protein